LSEHHQKTFISIREFIESWDKELYELNNLDFFIFLMINHLGNQLEKRFFVESRRQSDLFLDFDHIGTVCFNLGDSFEFFLEDNCLGSCPVNCLRDLDGQIDGDAMKLEEKIKRKLEILQSFLVGKLDKEQCLRIDLMNHVILDTLLQFYSEELNLEFDENNLMLLELAEFIEDVILDFIRFEGQPLLNKPFDIALEYFEDLLQSESEEKSEKEWYEENRNWKESSEILDWEKSNKSLDEVFVQFLGDEHYNPKVADNSLAHDIEYLSKYLKEYAKIEKISEFDQYHLAEFMSTWLAREFIMADSKAISHIFRATARFITFLYHYYNINMKRDFLKLYDTLKTDLPRVIQATNAFISDYNLLEAVLVSEQNEVEQKVGYFEILNVKDRLHRLLEVQSVNNHTQNMILKLNSTAFFKVNRGDIVHATIIKRSLDWEVLEIQFIYPNVSKNYIG
jgi:hypothetical protein